MQYKICEYKDGKDNTRYTVSFRRDYWPFWTQHTSWEHRLWGSYKDLIMFWSRDDALKAIEKMKKENEDERLSKYHHRKCEVIK